MVLHESYIRILCHDICILTIPKVHTGLSDVITRSKRIQKCSSQAYSYSAIACINSYISYQHVYLTFNYILTCLFAYKLTSDDIKWNRVASRRLLFFPDPNLISLVLDLNIFKLSSFKHIFIQFIPKHINRKITILPLTFIIFTI